jgi:small ligand-binding sensory domain FIST
MEGVHAAMTARNLEQNQWRNGGMAFGSRKTATAVIKPDREIHRNTCLFSALKGWVVQPVTSQNCCCNCVPYDNRISLSGNNICQRL